MENETNQINQEHEEEQSQKTDVVEVTEAIKTEETVSGDVQQQVNYSENENKEQRNEMKLQETQSEKRQSEKDQKFTIVHDENSTDDEALTAECDILDFSSVKLLRGTITELERALRDSRELIKSRDEEIVSLRREIEKGREQIHKEQMKWQRKCTVVEERAREIQELKGKLRDSEKSNEELQERIKEIESPCSESDVLACCSSMKELIELKVELAEKDLLLQEIRKNNYPNFGGKEIVAKDGWKAGATSRPTAEECEQHNQLKLKFLRDAFFYFMIDFHSEEQMKAILAVLAYGDQREDVIIQAYRLRQRGKKFTVKEVSSRALTFLHEEI